VYSSWIKLLLNSFKFSLQRLKLIQAVLEASRQLLGILEHPRTKIFEQPVYATYDRTEIDDLLPESPHVIIGIINVLDVFGTYWSDPGQ
jgi:hypothetical protein